MKHKSTLLLLAGVIIAGIVAYSLSKKPTTEELQQQRQKLMAGFRAEEVGSFTIDDAGERITCRKSEDDADEWRIAEPLGLRADRWAAKGILDKLELAEKVSTILPQKGRPLDLAEYGLEPPARTVEIESSKGDRSWTVLIGKPAGIADAVYVAVEGEDAVYTVPQDVADKTDVELGDLRSKKLAPRISSLDLLAVEITAEPADGRDGFAVKCSKAGDTWEVTEPFVDLADDDAIRALTSKLFDHSLAKNDFIVDDPTKAAEYGLDEPQLALSVSSDEQSHTVLLSGKQEEAETELYAMLKGEPAIVRVPRSLYDDLRKAPSDLRSRRLSDAAQYDVAEMQITAGDTELLIKKSDDDWEIAGKEPTAADRDLVEDLIRDLKAARVDRFVADADDDLAPYGLTEEGRTLLVMRDKDGDTLTELAFGGRDEADGAVYVARPPYAPVLAVKTDDYLDRIRAGRLAFVDRLILEEPRSEATEVAVTRGARRQRCTLNKEADRWELAEPVQGRADQWAVRDVLADFANLRVERFVVENADNPAQYGLAQPEATVSITYKPAGLTGDQGAQERARTLQVGAPADEPEGARYARLEDDPRVFVIGRGVVERLGADFASKVICDVAGPVGLTFHMDQRTETFAYDADKKLWTDSTGLERKDVAQAAGLLGRLEGVAVADYTEKSAAHYGFDRPYLIVQVDEDAAKGKKVVIGKQTEKGHRLAKGPATGFVHVISESDVLTLSRPLQPSVE